MRTSLNGFDDIFKMDFVNNLSGSVEIFFFNDPSSFWRIFFLLTMVALIVGLKLVSAV